MDIKSTQATAGEEIATLDSANRKTNGAATEDECTGDDCPVVVGGDTVSLEGMEGAFAGEASVYYDGALAPRPTPYGLESVGPEEDVDQDELTHDTTPILYDEIDPDNTVRFGSETGPFA